jgi:outer membrane immunogenic protein
MHRKRRCLLLLVPAIAVIFSLPAFAQEERSEVSADFTGDFPAQASGLGLTDKPTNSSGLLVNYRYDFNDWSAIEINYDYTQFSQYYGPPRFTSASFVTRASANEATLGYVLTFGQPTGARYRPFVEAGTGALFFSPVSKGSTVAGLTQDRAAFLYGGGVDWNAAPNVSVRLGYRGLVYRAPDFVVPVQVTNAMAHLAEPYIGVVVRF